MRSFLCGMGQRSHTESGKRDDFDGGQADDDSCQNHGSQFDIDFSNWWRHQHTVMSKPQYGVQVGQGIKLQRNTGTSLLGQQVDPNSLWPLEVRPLG